MLSKRIIRTAVVSLLSLGLLIAVPLLSVLNTRAASTRQEGGSQNYDGVIPSNEYSVAINVTSFVPTTGLSNLHFIISQLDADGNFISGARNTTLSMVANSRVTAFNNLDAIPQLDVGYSAIASSSNNYPFDTYTVAGTFELFTGTNNSVPSFVFLSGSIDSWSVDSEVDGGSTPGQTTVYMTLNITRNVIIQFFAVFIAIVMWVVSISALVMASTIWIRHRKVEPPTIAVTGALLFALPAMRNNVPGNPAIGVTYDIASYFWCLLIVAISVVMLMWNYIVMYKAEKKVIEGSSQAAVVAEEKAVDPKTPTLMEDANQQTALQIPEVFTQAK